MAADPTGRPPAKNPCIYWETGTGCQATTYFDEEEITCYNSGTCDGFGTCRGCSKYDRGGLKMAQLDASGGESSTPMNLRVYNIRAKAKKCCNWNGEAVELKLGYRKTGSSLNVNSVNSLSTNGSIEIEVIEAISDEWPKSSGRAVLYKEGEDQLGNRYPVFNLYYNTLLDGLFTGVTISNYTEVGALDNTYGLYLSNLKPVPDLKPVSHDPNPLLGESTTKCVVAQAAPWQEAFTEDNPYSLGCNGAKAECPYYTGPAFTEIVDSKMDKGDRVTAKQIMELRFYSKDWSSFPDPTVVWEQSFSEPYIWAWAREVISADDEGNVELSELSGRLDITTGKPMIQKVSVGDLRRKTPSFVVGQPVVPSVGTPVVGAPPSYPSLIKEIEDLSFESQVIFPQNTTELQPFVKRAFTHDSRFFYVAASINSDREVIAVNLTKNSQGTLPDEYFLKQLRNNSPEDLYYPFTSALPGSTFNVELTTGGSTSRVNHIRIFIDTGEGELDTDDDVEVFGSIIDSTDNIKPSLPTGNKRYLKLDVYIDFYFYHAHIAQESFTDFYGHSMVDPWVNNFTKFKAAGKILNLTGNAEFDSVFWNTISGEGKQTVYSIEKQEEEDSLAADKVLWEVLDCNYILVTFLNNKVNRTAPWAAWGLDSNDAELYVEVDRTGNDDVANAEGEPVIEGAPVTVRLELALASTKGTILPANMAIFKLPEDIFVFKPFNVEKDVLKVRYAYTEYRQGPIKEEDEAILKRKADLDEKVIDALPYDISVEDNNFTVEGSFVRAGDLKVHTCQEVLGDCFDKQSRDNEQEARIVFFKGGVGEGDIKTVSEMVTTCRDDFETKFGTSKFEDGKQVTYEELSNRLGTLNLKEGSLHFLFIFKDELGRPIGVKNTALLAQSSIAQARDVEIKYEWGGQLQHYPNQDGQFVLAAFYKPLYATNQYLLNSMVAYEPFCGDHAESNIGLNGYTSFSLEVEKHGALWYPYNNCLTPFYHVNRDEGHLSPAEYNGVVEGFEGNKRRNYWERMRAFDRFTPFIMAFINRIGCYWSERTSTAEVQGPFQFLGYTKIRSMHYFGQWATDRESLRVSRHWEKRNLSIEQDTLRVEDGEYTLSLSPELKEILLDDNGDINEGQNLETPVWVHINDGYTAVSPTSEELLHPFGNYTLKRTGDLLFNEDYAYSEDNRYDLNEVFEERDYTTTTVRNTDGSKIYQPDSTSINVEGGLTLREDKGTDIRYAFSELPSQGQSSWAWLAAPPDILRYNRVIEGISIKNPETTYFSEDRTPASFTSEGVHELQYTAHTFDTEGKLKTAAYITLDSGPKLFVVFKSKQLDPLISGEGVYILQENDASPEEFAALPAQPASPYDSTEQSSNFILAGSSSPGNDYIVLADSTGKRTFKIGDETYSTLAGVLINKSVDIDELPYDNLTIGKNSGFGMGQSNIVDTVKEYETTSAFDTGKIDLKGHYYVESIEIEATYGDEYDIPSIQADGVIYGDNSNTTLIRPTSYLKGSGVSRGERLSQSIPIGVRLTSLVIYFGARPQNKKFNLTGITIHYRQPKSAVEEIKVYSVKANISTANTGTHVPSQLEFYFNRSYPDFAKSYAGGQISLTETDFDYFVTPLPKTTVKFSSRKVKDIIPQFEFTDPLGGRFSYDNLDVTTIPGYTEDAEAFGGTQRFISGKIKTGSKGWTMSTTDHQDDPGASLTHENSFSGGVPLHNLQEDIYNQAGSLLGDAVSVYNSFWHPREVEVLEYYGVQLETYSWELKLTSTVAPIDRIFKHYQYGCNNQATSEYYDGKVHTVEPWQARGAFHYQCDPKYNAACIATVMNKCTYFFWEDYGKESYLNNNVIQRFSHVWTIPASDWQSYEAKGLIDTGYIGGSIGGILPAFPQTALPLSSRYDGVRNYPLDPFKPSEFQ